MTLSRDNRRKALKKEPLQQAKPVKIPPAIKRIKKFLKRGGVINRPNYTIEEE